MISINRKITKKVRVGSLYIGGDSSITIQSMTNTDTRDVKATVEQIKRLEDVGCEIVRVAIPDMQAAECINDIKKQINIPLVCDIHFDHKLALECIKRGVDKVRINPGNIGDIDRVKQVVTAAKERGVPIRIGVNSGSLEKPLLDKYGVSAYAMVQSALGHIKILEDLDFNDIIVSLKASNVPLTVETYKEFSKVSDYPLHVGVTEAGTVWSGTIKSAVGIGSILSQGIGDTLRVSLTGDPVEEIGVGINILKSLKIRKDGIDFISCPTCGRTQVDLITIANEVEKRLSQVDKPLKVAVMGCAVNGPGEAREADIGIAGGKGEVILFKKGEIVRKIPEENAIDELLREIEKM
ncbi:MAG TPA: 4-hydroxy-3-methylbut-2-en-1-yl diphosphate synthase [Lachnospiraceae bacterium]|nr:4-hydroxy-3-methylbut-2-en-1-yl diphosphate synthase [Lachnospiraceae bacterium]